MSDVPRHLRRDELRDADPTPGMRREQAIVRDGLWSGLAHTDPGMVSGWHHHGDCETVIYVRSGAFRLECGPGGRTVIDAQPGDFVHVPRRAVHREANPADEVATLVLVRTGHGVPTVNVAGPEADVAP
ncbi:MAG TPA: cupin domain-containing protein [Candidatus Dormibacteraeota bacterium]|nr:cupin domain-containing protein [Candidatus Dormibacteraeota bacterium]